jgi:hypothetical protein
MQKEQAMQWMRAITLLTIGILAAASQSGCLLAAAAGAAAGTVAYVSGDLESILEAPPEKVIHASKTTMNDMKFTIVSAQASATDGELIARTATDNRIKIQVRSASANTSKISIRVGTFGDESLSTQILAKIRENLK